MFKATNLEIPILDFKPLSSLRFFALQSYEDFVIGAPVRISNNCYWSDERLGVNPAGPFIDLQTALENWKVLMIEHQRVSKALQKIPNNVRTVDFISKKR